MITTLFLLLSTLGYAQKSNAGGDDVEKRLQEFSNALVSGDSVSLAKLCAPGFTLLEAGEIYDFNSAFTAIKKMLSTGETIRNISDLHTEVRGNVAWSWYTVEVNIRTQDDGNSFSSVETVILEKIGKEWKIAHIASIHTSPPKEQ